MARWFVLQASWVASEQQITWGLGRSSSKVTDNPCKIAAEGWGRWEAPGAAQGEEESTGREAAV